MQSQVQHMLEKLEHLSPERLAEVELHAIQSSGNCMLDVAERCGYQSEAAFSKVWDNDDDAVYDNL